jgi:Domain of unknown function (DUF4892)
MKKIFYLFCLLCFALRVQSSTLNFQVYPSAREVFHSSEQQDQYWLALGVHRKIEGIWQADKAQRLSGLLERTTLELPANHSAEKGFEFFKQQLEALNARELFHCKARDCGTSNSWANNHFKVIQLYGLDQYQFYSAYEIASANAKPVYVALYVVMRGNKRTYVQLEVLRANKQAEIYSSASSRRDKMGR